MSPLPQHHSSAQDMLGSISGFWLSQAIYVAAKLGIADLLQDGPKSTLALAKRAEAHEPSLYRVLRALASRGIFTEHTGCRFALSPAAEWLRSDQPGSLRPYAIMMGEQWVWRSVGDMLHSVRTGEPGFQHVFGARTFDYYADHPDGARFAIEGMTSRSAAENIAIVDAYDFSGASAIIDVAGGQGSLLCSILLANSHLHGTLFDMRHVIDTAGALLERHGLSGRCQLAAGDFFDFVPAGADIYILKKVIHDWADTDARIILSNCRGSMTKTGRLLLIELVVAPPNAPSFAKMLDLLMLAYAGGRERTEDEYRELLSSAGFCLLRVIPTASPVSIIEAIPFDPAE
jgi:O-methyltransferase domain/Dimerisation domain